jgi:16S rRNA C1402 N4-methylase RsmH
MSIPKYPRKWNEARIQRVLEYYESQTDEEVAAEIEAGLESTTMEVPRALVPVVRELIAKRKSSRTKKTHNTTLQPPSRAQRKSKTQRGSRAARG